MAMILDVDGKQFANPDETVIAAAIESIDKRTGFIHGGISLVTLAKEGVGAITAAGHPTEGFSLSYNEGDSLKEYFNDQTLPMHEIISILQSYARGDDWGKSKFSWEQLETFDSKTQIKRLLWIVIISLLLFFVIWLSKGWLFEE